ncbi:MAG: ankyrin repeat domain-containing protein [Pyrinomonadaceae bacterium]|nr:ankyrin repeat domain-containing protein [Pyrinomonadaceae bacterium]
MTRRNILLLSLLSLFVVISTTANAQDLNQQLFDAARKGDAGAVKALLAKGADVNAKFRYGATALSYASDKGHLEVVKVLLDNKADVNVKDTFYSATPIIWAAQKGHAGIVAALLDKGAEGRDTALMIGASGGNLEIVKAVLERGQLTAETLSNALGAATRANHPEVAELLTKAGAVPPKPATFQVDVETLKTYVGVYKSSDKGFEGFEIAVTLKDGKLLGQPTGQPALPLGATDKVTFQPDGVAGVTLTFNVENNQVSGLTMKQGTTTLLMKKASQ